MNLLVLNAGSGSQKCSLFRLADSAAPKRPREPIWEAGLDATAPGQPPGKILLQVRRAGVTEPADVVDAELSTAERTRRLLKLLRDRRHGAPPSSGAISGIGHRVVHGGTEYSAAVRIDAAVEAAIERLAAIAPLHNPSNLTGIRVARELFGREVPQFAVFDTAFHRTLPAAAAAYAGPHAWLVEGIRRYGFHGTNFRWVSEEAARLMNRESDPDLALVLCHLGGGCSLCATRGGRSVDTTMGFTPLDGIAMCTRSGAVDPGILFYLLRQGRKVDELERVLNKESGLKGLSGLSGDTRVLAPRIALGDARASLAWDVFVHRLVAGIGAMIASLGQKPDALVFTDAIGEDEPAIRTAACQPFAFLGLRLDPGRNARSPLDSDLASPDSSIRVLLVQSREAWQIARECHPLTRFAAAARRPGGIAGPAGVNRFAASPPRRRNRPFPCDGRGR